MRWSWVVSAGLLALCQGFSNNQRTARMPSHWKCRSLPSPVARSTGACRMSSDDEVTASDRLREEAANPFRLLRYFVYGSAGASAAIGGFTSASQLAASASGVSNGLPQDQLLQNIAIDGAVILASIGLWRWDSEQQKQALQRMVARDKRSKTKLDTAAQKSLASELQGLSLEVVVGGSEDATRQATVQELNEGAKQHLVVVAGTTSMVRESLIKAQILGERFARQNVLVVPYYFDSNGPSKGFAKDTLISKPYIARIPETSDVSVNPVEDWASYIQRELDTAVSQSPGATTVDLKAEGIVVVLNRDGKIVRRGLGVPLWATVIDDLAPAAQTSK